MFKQTGAADEHSGPLVLSMIEKLQPHIVGAIQHEPCTIYRVLQNIRDTDPRSYEPEILSIGPYHHGKPRLHGMEDHKWRYLHNLLVRDPQSNSVRVLEECVEKVKGSEACARRCYAEPVELGSDDFVKMMVLDGCFLLELFLRFHESCEDDPVFHVGWIQTYINRDILKLENQMPFFILEDLFNVAVATSVTDLFLRELAFFYLMWRRAETPSTGKKVCHLLHFYHWVLQPTSPDTSTIICAPGSCAQYVLRKVNPFIFSSGTLPTFHRCPPSNEIGQTAIPSVVELEEAGIKIRKKPAKTFLDVTFRDSTLDIPLLCIEDDMDSVFRNLVALEQCCPKLGNHFTWYVTFLACIVNTAKDVAILQQRGIIHNMLGSEERVALLINQLGKEMSMTRTNHHFAKLFREVNQHCHSRWNKHRARLMREYFSNPWSIISLVAAIALLLMTAAQVVFAVLSYRKQ